MTYCLAVRLEQVRTGCEQGLQRTLGSLPELDWQSAPDAATLAPD